MTDTKATINSNLPEQQIFSTAPLRYDGKQLRDKTGARKTVDYHAMSALHIHNRTFQRDHRDRRAIQPHPLYNVLLPPPISFKDKPITSVCSRLVRTATNKVKSPIFCVRWTPEGRRLVTASHNGEFTLWEGKTFSFETIQIAHNSAVRDMKWSHNGRWMISADQGGFVKYWQSNMNNFFMKQIHKDVVRGLSFSPNDSKFVSCSDDNTIRRWDFETGDEECIFQGHGSEVRCVDWNPLLKIIASGSKDSNMPVKLWDAVSGNYIDTIHAHKNPVVDVKWSKNENFFLTASRDSTLMLFDLRNRSMPCRIFRGHKAEVTTIAWHPIHSELFASGGSDGSINFWQTEIEVPIGRTENAHDSQVWSLDWHPFGHVLVSGSNDYSTKFWTRNRLGDRCNTPEEPDDDHEGFCETAHKTEGTAAEPSAFPIPGLGVPPSDPAPKDVPRRNNKRRHEPEEQERKEKLRRYD